MSREPAPFPSQICPCSPALSFEKMCPTEGDLHLEEVAPEYLGPLHLHRLRTAGLGGPPHTDCPVTMAIQESHDNSH